MSRASIDDALALVTEHFRGIADEDGEPYIEHCLRVMHGVGSDPLAQQVALMHDLIEDTAVQVSDLERLDFDPRVIEAVDLITHRRDVSYASYIVGLSDNPLARAAKLADLRDNASLSRVLFRQEQESPDTQRIQRYILSYQYLEGRLDEPSYLERMSRIR